MNVKWKFISGDRPIMIHTIIIFYSRVNKYKTCQFLQSNLPLSMVTGAQIKPLRPPPTVKTPWIIGTLLSCHLKLTKIPQQILHVSGSVEFPRDQGAEASFLKLFFSSLIFLILELFFVLCQKNITSIKNKITSLTLSCLDLHPSSLSLICLSLCLLIWFLQEFYFGTFFVMKVWRRQMILLKVV